MITKNNRVHLVMFDIDGTLTATMGVDEECFIQTFLEVFGIAGIDSDWSTYPHATDASIFRHIYTSRFGQPPTQQDLAQFRQRFVELLAAAASRAPFTAIAGAEQLLSRLGRRDGYGVALATGGWSESARLKMASAGLCFDDHPAASADDAQEREAIMKISLQRAAQQYGGPFASIVYVGDGVWDARACRALDIPFIGIGWGTRAEQLAAEGAVRVFKDFPGGDLFLDCLNELAGPAR